MANSSSTDVNSVLNKIHDLIQSSGLHFIINQTPWTSYITIRRKFVYPRDSPVKPTNIDELFDLREENKQLKSRVRDLNEALVDTEEEFKIHENKAKVTVENLHDKIDRLEFSFRDSQNNLNKKNAEFKNFEREAQKKEKKAKKKLKQSAKKKVNISVPEPVPNNESESNNNKEAKVEQVFECEICDRVFKSKNKLEEHNVDEHLEVHRKVSMMFQEHNKASCDLLKDIPESEIILTPEEITQFGVNWKIHLEIIEQFGLMSEEHVI